jgi:virginiamycin A acetyltransferase
MNASTIFPRSNDNQTVLLKNIIKNQNIQVGDFTYYHDMTDPLQFEKNNVLYHYPVNNEKLVIGKYCSIACGAKILFNGGNHRSSSLSNFPFAIFTELFPSDLNITDSWDNKGDIIIGNDVWIGYEALIMAGVTIGDGARIGSRSIVTRDVAPYEVVAGAPARVVRKRFDDDTISELLKIKWWDMNASEVERIIPFLTEGDLGKLKSAVLGK